MNTIYSSSIYEAKIDQDRNSVLLYDKMAEVSFAIPIGTFDDIVSYYLTSRGLTIRPMHSVPAQSTSAKDINILDALMQVANHSAKKNGSDQPLTIGWFAAICGTAKKNLVGYSGPAKPSFKAATAKDKFFGSADDDDDSDPGDLPF